MSSRGPLDDPDRTRSDDLRDEVAFYLEERVRELEARGMTTAEARKVAERAFGDIDEVVAELERIERGRNREVRMRGLIGGMRRDFHYALRGLVRAPGFTLVAVLTLGIGIGAVTAIFSVVNGSLLRALPFEDGDGIVFLQGAYAAPEGPAIRGASPAEARDWEAMSRSFSEVSVADGYDFTLAGDGPAEVILAERVGEGYFELLRVEPLLGRRFTQDEYRVSSTYFVALLGYDLWTRRYGADPAIVGRHISLEGRPWTVVGVLPPGFRGTTLRADLVVPLAATLDDFAERGDRFLTVVARLATGVSVEDAQADMDVVASRLEEAYPDDHEDRIALVTPARDVYLGTTRTLMLVVLGAAGLLLVITAANVANLILVKGTAREGELVVRRALGAGRRQLLGQFITESVALSAIGAAVGFLLGVWGARGLTAAMPEALLPAFVDVRPDATVFLVVAGLMTLVGLGVGLAPGLAAARNDVAGALRARGRGGLHSSRLQSALVVGEVAAALLLLMSGGLMARSLRAQLEVDPGYDFEALYAFSVFLPEEGYAESEVGPALDDLLARLESRPEVAGATFMSDLPLRRSGRSATGLQIGDDLTNQDRRRVYQHRVGPDWFETMGIGLVSGRPIHAADSEAELPVVVVSKALADRYFAQEDPIGRSVFLPSRTDLPFTVVGVAEDVRHRDLTSDIRGGFDDPDVYFPWERFPVRSVSIALRPQAGEPGALDPVARQVTAEFDPLLPLANAGPLADDLRSETAQARFGSILLAVFSALALTLSLIGLYGVVAFAAGRRKREIAVRIALGAERQRVRRMVVWHGLRLAGMGVVAGAALSGLAGRSLEAFLYGVGPLDPLTLVAVSALMAGAAAFAAWVPAVQASRADPQQALRDE
jgi:putative ABC transport system permease protein